MKRLRTKRYWFVAIANVAVKHFIETGSGILLGFRQLQRYVAAGRPSLIMHQRLLNPII